METLMDQVKRERQSISDTGLEAKINSISQIVSKTNKSFDQVVRVLEVMEFERRNNLFIDNGDVFDEQMIRFRRILEEIFNRLASLNEKHSPFKFETPERIFKLPKKEDIA